MTRLHTCRIALWVLALSAAVLLPGRSAAQKEAKSLPKSVAQESGWSTSTEPASPVCKVYALHDISPDAAHCKWVAETIQRVIEPTSWSDKGGKHVLTCDPAARVLVVSHTPATQAQVAQFLDNLKNATSHGKGQSMMPASKSQTVLPASFADSGTVSHSNTPVVPGNYAVPVPKQQPKHLFHFIIRYEGEGIIDSNVVDLFRTQAGLASAFGGGCCTMPTTNMPQATQSPFGPTPGANLPNPLTTGNGSTNSAPISNNPGAQAPLPAPQSHSN